LFSLFLIFLVFPRFLYACAVGSSWCSSFFIQHEFYYVVFIAWPPVEGEHEHKNFDPEHPPARDSKGSCLALFLCSCLIQFVLCRALALNLPKPKQAKPLNNKQGPTEVASEGGIRRRNPSGPNPLSWPANLQKQAKPCSCSKAQRRCGTVGVNPESSKYPTPFNTPPPMSPIPYQTPPPR